jgi:spermidine synthase
MPGSFHRLRFDVPFVVEEDGVRSLHFTHGEVQSSMRPNRPDELALDYTRTMMGFLLLQPTPRRIGMIGLGGGSLAKFCHRHLPSARITVVDNNPGVIALRGQFGVPADDGRFEVITGDGGAFIRECAGVFDVLLVDAFDASGLPPHLCSEAFYAGCFRALLPGGVLVANLHADDVGHADYVQRLGAAFRGNAMQVLSVEQSNCVVIAGRERPVTLEALRRLDWAGALDPKVQRQLRAEFAHIGWSAAKITPKAPVGP